MTTTVLDRGQRIASSDTLVCGIFHPLLNITPWSIPLKFQRPLLSLVSACLLLLSHQASALGPGTDPRGMAIGPGAPQAMPFGGINREGQGGVRPENLKGPSGTVCNSRSTNSGTTRRDPSGKVQIFNDTRSLRSRSGNVYGNCNDSASAIGKRLPGTASGGATGRLTGKNKPKSAFNSQTNTLKAASDGYVDRSATSSMMPRKRASLYDPATGGLRQPKVMDPYQIYQR